MFVLVPKQDESIENLMEFGWMKGQQNKCIGNVNTEHKKILYLLSTETWLMKGDGDDGIENGGGWCVGAVYKMGDWKKEFDSISLKFLISLKL